MKRSITWLGAVALAFALASCGGGDDGVVSSAPPPPPPPPNTGLGQAIAAAAANPANDSSANSSSAFKVLQDNGVAAVFVASPPVVNFTVFSDGRVVQGLTLSNVSLAIAKLVPGVNGEIDQWQSYVYRTETTTGSNAVGSGPGGTPVLASATQAQTDPKPASQANQLVFNPDGYYTYTFSTDIEDPTKTNGVMFEPNRTHRVAIQLSYTNAAGQTVRVNPYIDVTFDANGRSVLVTNPANTRVMADVSSCNACHDRLALHGGGRVDTQFCVMCHNPGTTDANSGNVLTMQTMVHKIHSGRLLKEKLDSREGGEEYVIWGYQTSKHDYTEVTFPQDLRNCTVCHTAANPKTPQGDNWKSRPSKESCLTCHANGARSDFETTHTDFALAILGPGGKPNDIPNFSCAECHRVGTSVSAERVHFVQSIVNSAKYRINFESATFNAAARVVTVKYFVSDPTNNNAAYNLVTADCTGIGPLVNCDRNTQFGNLTLNLLYQNLVGQPTAVTEFTAYSNGGSGAAVDMYKGTNDGRNHYTIDIPLPADSATAVAQGTARVVSTGSIKEPELEVKSATDPRPPVSPPNLINVVAQQTYADVALSGPLNPRRQVVSNDKCNACHGLLGTVRQTGESKGTEALHGNARNAVEECVLCHDAGRMGTTVMTNGMSLAESFSFKRMIHGIHGNSKRTTPFTHGNSVIGIFSKDGILGPAGGFDAGISLTAPVGTPAIPYASNNAVPPGTPFGPLVISYAAEVAYPAVGLNCNGCHVNDSWKDDRSPVGAVVSKPLIGTTMPLSVDSNPLNWFVISPKAATCTSCHDSSKAISHVVGAGGASFGNLSQGQTMQMQESCNDCHAPNRPLGVDVVHK